MEESETGGREGGKGEREGEESVDGGKEKGKGKNEVRLEERRGVCVEPEERGGVGRARGKGEGRGRVCGRGRG